MTLLPFRMERRAGSTLSALLMVPALLASVTLTFAAPPVSTPDQEAKHDNKAYTFARLFKVKEISHYKAKATVNQDYLQRGNVEIVTNVAYHETIKEIKPNGSAVFTSEAESASISIDGMEKDLTGSVPTLTTTIDKQGHVVDSKIEGASPDGPHLATSLMIIGQQGGFFPVKPIKVGETWKFEKPARERINLKETGTAAFLGIDTLNGMQTYKVKMVSDGENTIDQPGKLGAKLNFKVHEEGIVNFDSLSGKMVKMTRTVTLTLTSDGVPSGKLKDDLTITLVTSDDNPPPLKTPPIKQTSRLTQARA